MQHGWGHVSMACCPRPRGRPCSCCKGHGTAGSLARRGASGRAARAASQGAHNSLTGSPSSYNLSLCWSTTSLAPLSIVRYTCVRAGGGGGQGAARLQPCTHHQSDEGFATRPLHSSYWALPAVLSHSSQHAWWPTLPRFSRSGRMCVCVCVCVHPCACGHCLAVLCSAP